MIRGIGLLTFMGMLALLSCMKKQASEASESDTAASAVQPAGSPHAFIQLWDGSEVAGSIVASSQIALVVAGDDGIERKIPIAQIRSVEYAEAHRTRTAKRAVREPARLKAPVSQHAASPGQLVSEADREAFPITAPVPIPVPVPAATAHKYVLPAGSEVSVRTNEAIDSATAAEGKTFDAQVTRDATDTSGAVVIPRGSRASILIKSASKGGRFRSTSDLVLDMQSVNINGRQYAIDTADITQKGKYGVGINKRTAEYTGGGAALGAIIGAIAGGGKGAAIGAGAGAGAGALTQILTKGGSIKVPAESVLTFQLDQPLQVTAVD
jgi:hypothetical protein